MTATSSGKRGHKASFDASRVPRLPLGGLAEAPDAGLQQVRVSPKSKSAVAQTKSSD